MIIKEPYDFGDGRIGTKTYSDNTRYKIRKIGTDEIYSEAIDVLTFEYEEITEAEMEAGYGSNK